MTFRLGDADENVDISIGENMWQGKKARLAWAECGLVIFSANLNFVVDKHDKLPKFVPRFENPRLSSMEKN